MRALFTSILLFVLASAWGQGQVTIIEQGQVRSLFENYVAKNRSEEQIQGWRIQIISTDDRRKMERTKAKFSNMYPDVPVAWRHVVPYYQVRCGAYERREDLMSFLMRVKEDFPTATAVRETMDKFDLLDDIQ